MNLQQTSQSKVTTEFQWRSCTGKYYPVSSMDTRHLFHTFRMIWNHTMPKVARTGEFHKYHFGKQYTEAYMMQAIRAMLPELCNRKDLREEWWSAILTVRQFLETYQIPNRQMELI